MMADCIQAAKLQKKIDELEKQNQALNHEMNGLNNSLAQAKSENSKLNKQLEFSSKANAGLSTDNSILKAMISDNYRTEALRGKHDKLTVNAKKTNKLLVSFDLPGNVDNNIYFKVVTPEGKEFLSNRDLAAVIKITENGDGLLASSNPSEIAGSGTKRVEMSYQPARKLSEGIYQFNIYNEDRLLGSTQLRLK